jgi:hypothetical protein
MRAWKPLGLAAAFCIGFGLATLSVPPPELAQATISTETFRSSYVGNGATTAFATGFKFLANAHVIVVSRVTASGAETTQVEGTDYTLTGVGLDAGGTVTMTVAPASTVTLVIYRDTPLTQTTDLPIGGPFPSTTVEEAFDLGVMRAQEVAGDTAKALHYPVTDATSITSVLPNSATRASKFLGFDSAGAPIAAAGTSADLTPVSAFINTLLDDVDAATARTTLGAGDASVGSANTFTASQTIALSTAGNNLVARTTDAGATGSTILGDHASASPANSDVVLEIEARGNDTAAADQTFGRMQYVITDTTLGSEDAELRLQSVVAGAVSSRLRVGAGVYTPNATGGDKGIDTVNASEYYEDNVATAGNINSRTTDDVLSGSADFVPYYDAGGATVDKATLRRMSATGFLERQSASASATIDFALDGYAECRSFKIVADHALPATDGVNMHVRFSTDGGATFKAGAAEYGYHLLSVSAVGSANAAAAQIQLNGTTTIGNAAGEGVSGEISIINPSQAQETRIQIEIMMKGITSVMMGWQGWGHANTAEDTTDIRFLMSSGNIASGDFDLYCIRG